MTVNFTLRLPESLDALARGCRGTDVLESPGSCAPAREAQKTMTIFGKNTEDKVRVAQLAERFLEPVEF